IAQVARMAAAIAGARADLLRDPDAVGYFLNADLSPKALGTTIKNPDYAATLKTIASGGADAFYTGPIAKSIVDKIAASTGVLTGLLLGLIGWRSRGEAIAFGPHLCLGAAVMVFGEQTLRPLLYG
ncbi:MAG: hypothetical protein EBW20_08145, partial [Betaproteobacteria bacterium]|nr:hypothetical protein [Betaproteobacteria bacterium]